MTGVQTCALPICFPVTIEDDAKVSVGNYATVSAEDNATVSAEDDAKVSAGNYAKVSAGYNAKVSAGYYAKVSAGNDAKVSAGNYAKVSAEDLQVNSTDTQVTWSQVFDTTNLQAGVHSELNVDNMGRFMVLEDKVFTLDSDTPQKTCTYTISGSTLGSVRYNGPSDTALTDKGVYVIWAAFVMGVANTMALTDVDCPSPVGHSRLCFTDD